MLMDYDIKKATAKDLYMGGKSQKQIAKALSVSENTISKWAKEGKWEEIKISVYASRERLIGRTMFLIDYQITVMEREVEANIKADDYKYLENSRIDALAKLMACMKLKEIAPADEIRVIDGFMADMQNNNLELAKLVIEHADIYIANILQRNR